jgi:protein-S-isoprenylcysteine O-methyltransferase Ste14
MYVGYYLRRALFTKELLISGPLKYIRHSMYLGIYIMLFGLDFFFFDLVYNNAYFHSCLACGLQNRIKIKVSIS